MAEGKASEILILENMSVSDYYTHFYQWLDLNKPNANKI
jgi:hypothetical protein